jgi:ChrR Cupin-like domain
MLRDNQADVFTQASRIDWIPLFDGISFKPLRVSDETGTWTVIFRCQAGSSFAPHYHLSPGEYYMVSGKMDYRAGVAVAGDYGYEPVGAFHENTHFLEPTDIYFTNFGPLGFVDADKRISLLFDHVYVREAAAKAGITI